MSEFTKLVHACDLPELPKGNGAGTRWLCDCGKEYEWTCYPAIYDIPSSSGWRYLREPIIYIRQASKWEKFIAFIKGENK